MRVVLNIYKDNENQIYDSDREWVSDEASVMQAGEDFTEFMLSSLTQINEDEEG